MQNRQVKVHQHTKIAKRKQTTPVSERKVKCIYKQKMTGHVEGYRLELYIKNCSTISRRFKLYEAFQSELS